MTFRRFVLAIGAASLMLAPTIVTAQSSSQSLVLQAGQSFTVQCQGGGSLSVNQTAVDAIAGTCGQPAATATPTVTPTAVATATPTAVPAPPAGACGLSAPAFCDTFSTPMGNGNRSGDLNGVVWGISRISSGITNSAVTDPWTSFPRNTCGGVQVVQPEADNTVCNGMWVEGQDDQGQYTVLAGYPKQPFDVAGRTGKVVFDVNADFVNGLGHGAWPTFVYTDQPVPAPHEDKGGVATFARNSIGFAVGDVGGCPSGSVTVSSIWFTSNYQFGRYSNVSKPNCIAEPTQYGQLNHFEVLISATSVTVQATDAGQRTLKTLATVSNVTVPLTRGLVWFEDAHYNGNKSGGSQQVHTFTWANTGFDGPVLPKDLAFDVLDRTPTDLGWHTSATLNTLPMTAANISAASAALLTLTYYARTSEDVTYSVNGHPAHTFAWPFGAVAHYRWFTAAIPVPLSELVAGANSLTINTNAGDPIANVDIILVGAGG